MDPPSMESGRFLPIKIREGSSHFGNDDLFFFLCNYFPERAVVGSAFLFRWRRGDLFLGEHLLIYIMESQLAISLGRVAGRERKHLGEGVSRL